MISCIAIDDEPIALDILKAHAARVSFILLQQTFLSTLHALEYLQHTPVDLVLSDIHMPDLSGIELAKIISGKTKIIFTTAYANYAVQGFDLAVTDYLLKPIGFERFLQACTRASEQLLPSATEEESFFIKDGYHWIKINLANLLYVEASDNYLIFQETEKRTVTRMTLGEAAERLPADRFTRIHKSYIANFSRLEKIAKHQVWIGDKMIPLSVSYQRTVFNKLRYM